MNGPRTLTLFPRKHTLERDLFRWMLVIGGVIVAAVVLSGCVSHSLTRTKDSTSPDGTVERSFFGLKYRDTRPLGDTVGPLAGAAGTFLTESGGFGFPGLSLLGTALGSVAGWMGRGKVHTAADRAWDERDRQISHTPPIVVMANPGVPGNNSAVVPPGGVPST